MSPEVLSAAVAQFTAVPDVEKNLRRIEELTSDAVGQGAGLVVFPEASMYAWDVPAADLAMAADESAATFAAGVSSLASRTGVSLVVGAFAPAPGEAPRNRMLVCGPDGTLRASYDKLHLFDAFSWRESEKVSAPPPRADLAELCTVDVAGYRLGLLNCYDLRFPEMARALVERGANVLVVSSAWVNGPHKEMHWEMLLRARAIENTAYVLGAGQSPPASAGLSMIVDPLGQVGATVVSTEGVAVHRIDPRHLREVRETIPSLRHRRYRVVAASS